MLLLLPPGVLPVVEGPTDVLTGSKAGGWGGKAKVAVAAGSGSAVPACGVEESLDTTRMTKNTRFIFPTCSENFEGDAGLHSFISSSPRQRTPAAGGRGTGSGVGWSVVREPGGWQEGSADWRPETGVLPAAPRRSLSSVTAAGVNAPSSNEHIRLRGATE